MLRKALLLLSLTACAAPDLEHPTPQPAEPAPLDRETRIEPSPRPPASPCANVKCSGSHEECREQGSLAVCACVVGYARTAEGCAFRGGPEDPGFASAKSWKASANATLDPIAATTSVVGALDVGLARLHGDGVVSQSFDMPAFADAEPLAMEINAGCKGSCGNIAGSVMAVSIGATIETARAFDLVLPTQGLATRRVCLGERAYGRTVALSVSTFSPSTTLSGPDEDALVDSIRFVAAPECPAIGQVMNADFEKSGGWATGGTGLTEVAMGLGTNGSRAGRLLANGCERPNLSSTVSVPESLMRPALTFSIRGTRDRESSVSLDNRPIAALRGTGAFEQAVVCLPEWTRGFTHSLRISAGERYATCNTVTTGPNEVIVDDFKLISSDACPLTPNVLDGDFERSSGSAAWFEGVSDGASVAVIHGDAAAARSGHSLLQLSTFACSRQIIADQTVSAPVRASSGNAGPSLRFWYRVVKSVGGGGADGAGVITPIVAVGSTSESLPAVANWTEKRICMPTSSWGRSQYLGFGLSAGSSGSCGASLQIDDVVISTDSSCPAD